MYLCNSCFYNTGTVSFLLPEYITDGSFLLLCFLPAQFALAAFPVCASASNAPLLRVRAILGCLFMIENQIVLWF